jgi:hypothetical protein
MRLAVSGTHCSGKSTLIESFLLLHPEYMYEQEAYEALDSFPAEPSAEDFFPQLEYHITRLQKYRPNDRVIFERSPVDYVAYLKSLVDLRRDSGDRRLLEHSIRLAKDALEFLDLILYLPARDIDPDIPADEDLALRSAVDEQLISILVDNELDLINRNRPVVIEAAGTTAQRLRILEAALTSID